MGKAFKIATALMAMCAGASLALQSALNGALLVPLNNGLMSSFFSFMGGTTSLALIAPFTLGQKPRDKGANPKPVRWWMWLTGGSISVFYVTAGTFLGPKLGYGLFYAAVIAGQLSSGLIVDHFAFMDLPKKPATIWRIIATLVVLAGAIMAIADKLDVDGQSVGKVVGYVIVAFVGGALLTIQAPVNSALTIRIGTLPHRTALLSFSVALGFIAIIWAVSIPIIGGGLTKVHMDQTEWWMFFGGPLGAFYVEASVQLAPVLGVAWFFVAVIAGQLLMSLFVDSFGIANSTVVAPSALRIAGVVLVFVGAACFRLLPLGRKTRRLLRRKLRLETLEDSPQGSSEDRDPTETADIESLSNGEEEYTNDIVKAKCTDIEDPAEVSEIKENIVEVVENPQTITHQLANE